MTRLDYVSGTSILPSTAKFKISPSAINNFFAKPHDWFRSEVLGEDTFLGNTASVLGTIVHFCAEEYTKKQTVDVEEIEKFLSEIDNPDVNIDYVKNQWKPMAQALIDNIRAQGLPQRSEEMIKNEIIPDYFVAGSCDAVLGDCVVDYKTTSQLTPPTAIPPYYRYQLLAYAYMYNKIGIPINRIRIKWITNNAVGRISEKTGKPMKDYPATVADCTETITNEDMDFIESILKLICETVAYYKANPSLAYILFRDYRLKESDGK